MVKMALKKRKLGIPESAKRPKAQRKFAQGQFFPSTSSYAYNCNSVTTPPVNNYNVEPPPEIFTTRPNTEDFLTYLCYRGTPSLPTNLDFVKSAQQKSKNDMKKTNQNATTKSPGRKKAVSPNKNATEASTSSTTPVKRKDVSLNKSEADETPPSKTKKKEQVQENSANITKSLKGKKADVTSTTPSPKTVGKNKKKLNTNIRKSGRTRLNANNISDAGNSKELDDKNIENENIEHKNIINNEKIKNVNKDEPKVNKVVENVKEKEGLQNKKVEGKMTNSSPIVTGKEEVVKQEKHVGRPRKYPISPKVEKNVKKVEPLNKNNSVQEKIIDISVPEEKSPPTPTKNPRNKKTPKKLKVEKSNIEIENLEKEINGKATLLEKLEDLDDLPLKSRVLRKESPVKQQSEIPIVESPRPKETIEEQKLPRGKPRKNLQLKKAESEEKLNAEKISLNSVQDKKKLEKEKISDQKPVLKEKKEKKTPGRKKKIVIENKEEKEEIVEKLDDKPEDKPETGRPQRKTKEAAAIYMELIGHKLNSDNYEEDDNSSQSFPDLPNVKETEKLEQEMKLKVKVQSKKPVKEKEIPIPTPTPESDSDKPVKKTLEKTKPIKVKQKLAEKGGIVKKKTLVKKTLKKRKRKIIKKMKKHITGDTDKGSEDELNIENGENQNTFSESDDEPLAVKICKASESQPDTAQQKSPLPRNSCNLENSKSSNENLEPISKTNFVISNEPQSILQPEENHVKKQILTSTKTQLNVKPELPKSQEINDFSGKFPSFPPKPNVGVGLTQTPTVRQPTLETYPSAIVNPTFLTPKFEGNTDGRLPVTTEPSQRPINFSTTLKNGKNSPQGNLIRNPEESVPTISSFGFKNTITTTPTPSAFATNLMPSKEESGKIFGIASVSLAQSSGPDNTKCTLGKCGSIHKPTLGPVVPTESYLGEQLLSSKERRKAKVNMTHEQIHKWLIECSSNPDEIQDDLDEDFEDVYKYNSFSNPSPTLSKYEKEPTTSFNVKKEKEPSGTSNVKNESVWSGKGPSLKAVPVVVANDKDKEVFKSGDQTPTDNKKQNLFSITKSPVKLNFEEEKRDEIEEKKEIPKKVAQESSNLKTEGKPLKRKQEKAENNSNAKNKKPDLEKEKEKSPKSSSEKKGSSGSAKSAKKGADSPTNPPTTPNTPGASTSHLTFQSKKYSPIHSKLRQPTKDLDRLKVFSNTFTNSGEKEKSVYTFDKEDDELPPIARTFRQPVRRGSDAGEKPEKECEKPENKSDTKTKSSKNNENNSTSDIIKKGTINLNVNKHNEDDNDNDKVETTKSKKSSKIRRKSTINEFILNDSEGETFYIPIQGAGLSNSVGSNKSDLLQTVEVKVKVGREGPDGPNQRVSVQATLVRKPHLGRSSSPSLAISAINSATATAATESDDKKSVSKSSASQILASKSVPVGTVTPRFKSEGSSGNNSGLKRVNSNSSLLSGSNKSRNNKQKPSTSYTKKRKSTTPIKMYNNTAFPRRDDPAQMVEAPVFRPTDKEFHDPMEFIERITPIAARFGICKIIPPLSFKPECRVSDEMRFSAYNQYVHKMLYRWGPNVKELNAIKKHCQTQRVSLTPFPLIGQMQVDLPRLYHTVQELGGLQEVMEKKKWNRVADEMCVPKLAQDRATRLDDIYCKYLLPYDTLSTVERQKLFDEVESDWAKCEARARRTADFLVNSENNSFEENPNEPSEDSEEEADGVSMECIIRGKSMPLKQFVRIARNTCSLWFKNVEPTTPEVESEFWRHVAVRDSHVCVHSGSIDSSGWGYGFPSPGPKGKGSHCAKHPWNLKVLTNNPGSVLRSLGPVMGVTVPTLHVGMLFSACCWYRDPHGLSWIEYLHTGASKIWYGIPDDQSSNFRSALTTLIPSHCQNKTIWLPCDTVMVPPHMLTDRGVSLCRTEQKPGEFVVIFPRSYTSSISTGYVVSESVYFATATWLESAKDDFKDIHDSCEPALFSFEQLLFSIGSDQRVSKEVLEQCLPMLVEVFAKEKEARTQIEAFGVITIEKISQDKGKNKKKVVSIEEDNECDICRANLYISVVKSNDKNNTYCLEHALKYIRKGNISPDQCTLLYSYSIEEINDLIKKVRERLEQKKY